MAALSVMKQDPGPVTQTFKDRQFEDNLQEQRDEVLALTSIFNTEDEEKMKVLSEVTEENDGLFTLLMTVCPRPTHESVHVDLALPVEQDAEMEMAAAAAPTGDCGPPRLGPDIQLSRSISGRSWQGSFTVKYLSPLYLVTTFPPSYPSSEPPQIHMSSDWLTDSQLNSLSNMLDTLWKEGCQMPIVFTWVDWLEHNMLSHLGIADHLVLRPCVTQAEPKGDPQDIAQWEEDVGEIIAKMIRYNKEQRDIEFCQSMQECHVCYDEKQGTQFFRMHDCDHHYCHACMAQFCEVHVTQGTVEALRCPDTECDAIVPPYIVQAVMGPEAYQRWETLLLQKTLDAMSDTVYCPRCGSLVIAEAEEELRLAHCPVCYFAFCTQCNRGWHQGRNCATDEEMLEELQDRGRNQAGKRNDAEERKFQELLRKFQEEMSSKQTMKKGTRNCPHCKVPVEKIGGCNKMTCKCGKCFCWICGKPIDGYNHFRTGSCALFPGQTAPAVVGPIPRPAEGAMRIQARLAINPHLQNNRCFCPMCKQVNLKGEDKNNHIKCWNCKSNFCFLCKQRIIGNVMAHFTGPCDQHS